MLTIWSCFYLQELTKAREHREADYRLGLRMYFLTVLVLLLNSSATWLITRPHGMPGWSSNIVLARCCHLACSSLLLCARPSPPLRDTRRCPLPSNASASQADLSVAMATSMVR